MSGFLRRECERGGGLIGRASPVRQSPGHIALAFFATVLTHLCCDKVMRMTRVIKETTYRHDLYSLHFHLERLR